MISMCMCSLVFQDGTCNTIAHWTSYRTSKHAGTGLAQLLIIILATNLYNTAQGIYKNVAT